MQERYMTPSAVMLLLIRQNDDVQEILLQRRANTGYLDGMWDCAAAGHVDAGESMIQAVIREAHEELGIAIAYEDVRFATLTHKFTRETGNVYYNAFFTVSEYEGSPRIMEPEKCSDLQWFDMKHLPDDLIQDRRVAIHHYLGGISYSELGWGL